MQSNKWLSVPINIILANGNHRLVIILFSSLYQNWVQKIKHHTTGSATMLHEQADHPQFQMIHSTHSLNSVNLIQFVFKSGVCESPCLP